MEDLLLGLTYPFDSLDTPAGLYVYVSKAIEYEK